jgi:CRISPR-associated protein Cas1
MAFLYITEPGACLRKAGERFLVECDQHVLLDRPMHRLEHILLFGNVQVSSQAVAEALDGGVGVSFFTRNGRYRGTLTPGRDHSVDLRIAQYRLYADPARSLEWAKATVARKVSNGLAVVERYEARAREDAAADGMEAAVTAALKTLETAQTVAEVDGAEGSAAHAYFDALFGRFNRSSLAWPGRVKHPATDPLNALLSLGYTLLMNELLGLAEARGLDPALGFLHQLDGNRPALALDLMEPFRHPVVDRMVLTAVNRQMFSAEDFTSHGEDTGVVLTPEKFRRFLEEHERCMLAPVAPPPDGAASKATTIRRLLQQELLNFARALRGEIPWEPCAFPWKGEQEKACPTS